MLICSRVPEVALFIPELWLYIDFSADLRWIDLSHERTYNHPLSLLDWSK
jgi:hypothetical protein